MDKIIEAIKKLVPAEQVEEVTKAIQGTLADAKVELEKEFDAKLQEAYTQLSDELKNGEKVAEQGYQEAYTIISDLRTRLDTMRNEFESQLEEGYEEAYQMLLAERGKNEKLETTMYEEYDKKLAQMKDYMIDKIDEFLQFKGKEIYETAKRDVLSDPSLVEHKAVLNKIIETVSEYISDEDFAEMSTAKLEELKKQLEEAKSQTKILEARNIRIATENTKLTEAVRQKEQMLTESAKATVKGEKQERKESTQNATGRGKIVTENVEVIGETKNATVVTESATDEAFSDMRILAGISSKK